MGFSIGRGSKVGLSIQNTAGNTWTTNVYLNGVTGITLPQVEIEDVETSHFGTSGRSREYIPGLEEISDLEMEVLYDAKSVTDNLLASAASTRALCRVRIEVVGADPETWEGYCKSYSLEISDDEAMMKNPTFKINKLVPSANV